MHFRGAASILAETPHTPGHSARQVGPYAPRLIPWGRPAPYLCPDSHAICWGGRTSWSGPVTCRSFRRAASRTEAYRSRPWPHSRPSDRQLRQIFATPMELPGQPENGLNHKLTDPGQRLHASPCTGSFAGGTTCARKSASQGLLGRTQQLRDRQKYSVSPSAFRVHAGQVWYKFLRRSAPPGDTQSIGTLFRRMVTSQRARLVLEIGRAHV